MYKAKLEMKKRVFYLIELGEEHAKIKQKDRVLMSLWVFACRKMRKTVFIYLFYLRI